VTGAILGIVAHALTDGRRDFTSISAFRADHYDLLVDDTHADHATQLLAASSVARSWPTCSRASATAAMAEAATRPPNGGHRP
jgi:hypothetical protein